MPRQTAIYLDAAQEAAIAAHGGGPTEAIRDLMLRPSIGDSVRAALKICPPHLTAAERREVVLGFLAAESEDAGLLELLFPRAVEQ